MENKEVLINKFDIKEFEIFKLDYENQNLKSNASYEKFKNEIKKKYGNDAKLFRCNIDKIIFYYDCSKYPYYTAKCPKCQKFICYFCSFGRKYCEENCCAIYQIHSLFNVDALIFVDKYPRQIDFAINIKNVLIILLIPLINITYIICCIHSILFYRLLYKKSSPNQEYEDRIVQVITDRSYACCIIIFAFDGLGSILLSIPLFILSIYFFILLLLISLPFKFYPLKYFFGMIYLNEIG